VNGWLSSRIRNGKSNRKTRTEREKKRGRQWSVALLIGEKSENCAKRCEKGNQLSEDRVWDRPTGFGEPQQGAFLPESCGSMARLERTLGFVPQRQFSIHVRMTKLRRRSPRICFRHSRKRNALASKSDSRGGAPQGGGRPGEAACGGNPSQASTAHGCGPAERHGGQLCFTGPLWVSYVLLDRSNQ